MEKKSKKSIIIGITSLFLITLVLLGLTYAYYRTRVVGNEKDKSISVIATNLELTYNDGTDGVIGGEKLEPSDTVYTKEFTVTNTGNEMVSNYAVYLENVINTFAIYKDIEMTLDCVSVNTETQEVNGTCEGMSGYFPNNDDVLTINKIDVGITHKYTLSITYKDSGKDQSIDMGKSIRGKIQIYDIEDLKNLEISNEELLMQSIYDSRLNIGDYVNYDAGVSEYTGKWRVLGMEDGKLLLTSTVAIDADSSVDGITPLTLSGRQDYFDGISKLNTLCEPYGNGIGAEGARSIKVEDINDFTGYNPLKQINGLKFGQGKAGEYGMTGIYTIINDNGQNLVSFSGNNGVTGTGYDNNADTVIRGLKKVEDGTDLELEQTYQSTNTYYNYWALNVPEETYGCVKGTECVDNEHEIRKISDEMVSFLRIYKNKDNGKFAQEGYWLADQSTLQTTFTVSWGLMFCGLGEGGPTSPYEYDGIKVGRDYLFNSGVDYGKTKDTQTRYVRPVIYLKQDVKLIYVSDTEWNIG